MNKTTRRRTTPGTKTRHLRTIIVRAAGDSDSNWRQKRFWEG